MSVSGPTSKRLDKSVPAQVLLAGVDELRGRLAGGVLERAGAAVDAVAVHAQDDAPAAGLDLDHEALEAGRVVVDPASEARLVRLHGVGRGREARHGCCGSMEIAPAAVVWRNRS